MQYIKVSKYDYFGLPLIVKFGQKSLFNPRGCNRRTFVIKKKKKGFMDFLSIAYTLHVHQKNKKNLGIFSILFMACVLGENKMRENPLTCFWDSNFFIFFVLFLMLWSKMPPPSCLDSASVPQPSVFNMCLLVQHVRLNRASIGKEIYLTIGAF